MASERVSIPLRYAKNKQFHGTMREVRGVSIPLRYAKNAGKQGAGRCIFLFQFLLGTLKTDDLRLSLYDRGGFNSS